MSIVFIVVMVVALVVALRSSHFYHHPTDHICPDKASN